MAVFERSRVLAIALAAAVAVPFVLSSGVPSAHANNTSENFFALGPDLSGGQTGTYGANTPITFSGVFKYNLLCTEGTFGKGGHKDLLWPATDVYLVDDHVEPADRSELTQTGGGTPRTVISPGGVSIDEILGITAPGGTLAPGTYSVVYDTCQDGHYDAQEDLFIPDAVTVELPAVIPPAASFIADMKSAAKAKFYAMKVVEKVYHLLTHVGDYKEYFTCNAAIWRGYFNAGSSACSRAALAYLFDSDFFPESLYDQVENLARSDAQYYGSLYNDPPRSDFDQVTAAVTPAGLDPSPRNSATSAVLAGSLAVLGRQDALLAAFLASVERYQGAEEAGNAPAALARATEAESLARALSSAETDLQQRIASLPTALLADDPTFDSDISGMYGEMEQLRSTGFSSSEYKALRNAGYGPSQIATLRAALAARDNSELYGFNVASVSSAINGLASTASSTQLGFSQAADGFASAAAAMRASSAKAGSAVPAVTITVPPVTTVGVASTLTATVSNTASATIDWDLNSDGKFDDATGTVATVAFGVAGERVVSARVSGSGVSPYVLHALVNVVDGNRPPVLQNPSPTTPTVAATVGIPVSFSTAASDPDGDPLVATWTIDGVAAGTGPSLSRQFSNGDLGTPHTITEAVSDGHPGHTVVATWAVGVRGPDVDGDGWANTPTADCNDGDATIHPGATEVLLNGKDDDCDPATLDAPPAAGGGAVTGGSVAAWGYYFGTGPAYGPQLVAGITNATHVEMGLDDGIALRSDGTVSAFGPTGYYDRGCGQLSCPSGVTDVVGVGGTGKLTGVTSIAYQQDAGSRSVAAVRQDGSIVDWGVDNGRMGTGLTTVNYALSPMQVLRADNQQPLTGATSVSITRTRSWAVMGNGDVWIWGRQRGQGCIAPSRDLADQSYAEPVPEAGQVAQLVETNAVGVLARTADGRVELCATSTFPGFVAGVWTPVPGFGPSDVNGPARQVLVSKEGGFWILTERGELFGWGYMNGGSTIFGPTAPTYVASPTKVPLAPGAPVVSISGSASTFTTVRADGSVQIWGGNTFYSTGVSTAANTNIPPTPIDVLGIPVQTSVSPWSGGAVILPRAALAAGYSPPQTWIGLSVGPDTGSVSGPEGSTVAVPLRLTAAASTDTTVTWSFSGVTGTSVIPAGSTSGSATVTLPHDGINGPSIDTLFTATAVTGGVRIDNPSTTVTATDIDPAPSVSVAPVTVAEGNTNLTDIAATVSLSAASGFDTVAHLQTADGTALAGVDYRSASQDVPFAAGETSKVVHFTGIGNTVPQPDRQFSVQVSGVTNLSTATSTAPVTIKDDDPVALVTTGSSVVAGGVASVSISAPAQPAGESLTVNWSAASGSAVSGTDFTPSSGTVTLNGPTPVSVSVPTSPNAAAGAGPTVNQVQFSVVGTPVNSARTVLPATPAIVTITGLSGAVDSVPPVVTGTPDRAPNANGWYSAPVTITWTAVDAVAGTLTPPPPTVVSTESDGTGPAIVSASVCDPSGNCATGTVPAIKLDVTSPTISVATGGSPNLAGWYRTPVTVSFGCADALSGIAVCPAPVDLSDGANQSVSGTATDAAGNSATAGVSHLNIDTVAPVIAGTVTSSTNGAGWYRGDVGVSWSCSDVGSGVSGTCPANSTVTGEGSGLTTSATVSDVSGNSTVGVSPPVNIDRTAPVTTATAPAGWGGASVNVVLDAIDGLSGVAHTEWQLDGGAVNIGTAVTVSGNGTHTLVFHSVDLAGNAEASVTTKVTIAASGPTIKPLANPGPNANGWNNTAVTVSWTCADPNGIASCSGPTTLAGEGKDQKVTGTATDVFGNTTNGQQLVSIDLTPPTATPSLSATANAAGWFHTNVDVSWVCADTLSGVASCPSTSALTQAAPGPVVGSAKDNADNAVTVTVPAVKIDTTAPIVTILGVTDGGNYALGAAPVATCSATDDLSGVAGMCTVSVSGPASGAGAFTVTATATDVAGNVGTAKVTYQVASGVCVANTSGVGRKYREDEDCGDDHGEDGHHRGGWHDFDGEFKGKTPDGVTKEHYGTCVSVSFGLVGDDLLAYGPAEQPRWLTPVKLGPIVGPLDPRLSTREADSGANFTSTGTSWSYRWTPSRQQVGYYWRIGVRLASGETHTTIVAVTT